MDTTRSNAKFITTTMKERMAERNGPRRTVFGVRPNPKYEEERREIGLRQITQFPFKGGEQYVGEWAGNKKHGFGTRTSVKGTKYEGEWVAGKREGKGTVWVKERGNLRKQYAGDWVNDERHGTGVFIFQNGDRYEGEWERNKRHGQGRMVYASQAAGEEKAVVEYGGGWFEGKRSGYGVLHLRNGDRYEGHWLEDKKEGPGQYFYRSTNKVYEGEWVDDVPKCGQYKSAPPGSFSEEASSSLSSAHSPHPSISPFASHSYTESAQAEFRLPSLRLLGSESVFSEAVAKARQARAKHVNASGVRVFEDEEMDVLRQAFGAHDRDQAGFIVCEDLQSVFQSCGMDMSEDMVYEILASLDADLSSKLTFAEFVDLAAIITADN